MNALTKTKKQPAQVQQQDAPANQNNNDAQRLYVQAPVNVTETKDGYLLEADMPGVNREGLEALLDNNELTIIGHRNVPTPNGEQLYRESRNLDYRRVFQLDPSIDGSKIQARMENGVLRLELPKAERVKPRKITIS